MAHTVGNPGEMLISVATAALREAEADAAKTPGELIFRPEWRPTPRYRREGAGEDYSTWFPYVMNQLSEAGFQLDQLPIQPPPAEPAPSYAFAPPPLPPPPPPPPPRTATVLTSPTSLGSPLPPPPQLQEDVVKKLVERNRNAFDKIINHPFPKALSRGTASLDGFRYYMIQDKKYLEACALLKAMRLDIAEDFNVDEIKRLKDGLQSSADAITKLEESCTGMLGIHESTMKTTLPCDRLKTSKNFYTKSIRALPDDAKLLGYYIVLLPCVLSYFNIANRLVKDESTVTNVVYHPAWTVVNDDESSVGKYSKFINENIAKRGVSFAEWSSMFKTACDNEVGMFETGKQAPTPFQIIPDGDYFIHIPDSKMVVLAVRNVKELSRGSLDKRLRGYFSDNAGPLSVVGVRKRGDNDKWHAVATKDGYTFQNLGTHLYLGISSNELNRKNGRILKASYEPHYWWINPLLSKSRLKKKSPLYQICDSRDLQYTLNAYTEVFKVKTVGSTKPPCFPIAAHENSHDASCQAWVFDNKDQTADQSEVLTQEQEMKNAESKAQTMIAQLEEEIAMYSQNINLLRPQPEKTTSVNLDEQNQLLEKHTNGVKALRKEMVELIAENVKVQYRPKDISTLLAD